MRRLPVLLVSAALSWGAVAHHAEAGAWTQPKGEGFYKLGSQMVRSDDFRDIEGTEALIPTLADYTVSLYTEYGVRDDLTVVAYLPIFKRITLNRQVGRVSRFAYFEGDSKTGIADAAIGLRYRLWQGGGTVLSAGLTIGVPLGDDQQANGLLTGDGEINQALTVQLGRSLYPVPAYTNVEVGFNNRVEGYSDEFLYAAELGYTFRKIFTALLRIRGIESFENGDDSVSGGMGGLFANNQRYTTYGPELIYAPNERYGVSLSALSAVRLRNVLSAPTFSVGVFVRR